MNDTPKDHLNEFASLQKGKTLRQLKIEAIREACKNANPSAEWQTIKSGPGLADVLLAIGVARKRMICDASYQFPGLINIFPAPDAEPESIPEPTYCRWDGFNDDVTLQSDPTVDFLYNLFQ